MLRSLSTAVSGLRNHQNKLDVVGNNIANVNTVGYKYNAARFQDIFSQTIRGATAPQAGTGGINPMQVGLGMGLSSANTIHQQGAITRTGRETDLAIEGNGFFIVSDGVRNYYTRDGSFVRDSSGVLVNANGMVLMGWLPVEDKNGEEFIDISQPLGRIIIRLGEDSIATPTTLMEWAGNLDASKGIPSFLSLDAFSGIEGLFAGGLQYGAYRVITNTGGIAETVPAAAVRQEYVQSGESDILTLSGLTFAADVSSSIVLTVSQVDAATGMVFFTAVAHEYDSEGNYVPRTMGETAIDGTVGGNLMIGNITLEVAPITVANFTAGDKFLIAANAAGDEYVQIDAPGGVSHIWARDAGEFNDRNNILRFYTLSTTGAVFDGLVALNVGTMADSQGAHTSFTFTREDDSVYTYSAYAFDSLGNQHFLDFVFTKTNRNEWQYEIRHFQDLPVTNNRGTLLFRSNGRLAENSQVPTLSFDPCNGADRIEFTPKFDVITQLVADSNVIARKQDGFPAGELVAFNIQGTGIVSGIYTNGMVKDLAQVAMASFINPEGLVKIGANLYDVTANSGDARIGKPGEQGRGMIQSMALEMSNVDLANEFTEMITTSRAFQANSRVISTSDEVLMELINIKR